MRELEVGKTYELTGYVPFEKNGKILWKRGVTKVTPKRYGDVIEGALRTKVDKIKDLTFYHYQLTPEFVNQESCVFCYLVKRPDGEIVPRLSCQLSTKSCC